MSISIAADNTGVSTRGRPFTPGHSGNPAGRPKGARAKLGEEFIAALVADFGKHGAATIAKVREERPADYIKVIASILPKEIELGAETQGTLADIILARRKRVDAVA